VHFWVSSPHPLECECTFWQVFCCWISPGSGPNSRFRTKLKVQVLCFLEFTEDSLMVLKIWTLDIKCESTHLQRKE
jgi:hypothetical protein